MTYTPAYKTLQEAFHNSRPDYGTSGRKYADLVMNIANKINTKDILDWGCGKATLQKSLPFPIQNYDPFIPEYSNPPRMADFVVCTDVMEHIEPEHIDAVIQELIHLTGKILFLQIACRPAAKILPDGRNAHLTQQPCAWWLPKFLPYLELHSLNNTGADFIAVWGPLPKEPESEQQHDGT